MSKTLTEELIQERLEDKGVTVPHETSPDDKISQLQEIYAFNIVSDWQNCDAYFYTDETRDGYQIWVAAEDETNINLNEDVYYYDSEDETNINLNEDVYYYDSEWFEKLADYLRDGCRVYVDSYTQEEYGFEEVIEAMYEEWYMEEHDEVENELEAEGYEWPES